MVSAVRNGPMRAVEANRARIATVVARLVPRNPAQPIPVCGRFQVCVAMQRRASNAVEESSE